MLARAQQEKVIQAESMLQAHPFSGEAKLERETYGER